MVVLFCTCEWRYSMCNWKAMFFLKLGCCTLASSPQAWFMSSSSRCRHGIFLLIGGFLPIEMSYRSLLRSVQILWENYRVYWTCERFSESNFVGLPCASISFLHSTFSTGVNLFCFGHHQSIHVLLLWLTETTTREVTHSSFASHLFRNSRWIDGHFVCVFMMFRKLANWWQLL